MNRQMHPEAPAPAARRRFDLALIGGFALLLALPVLDLAFGIDPTTPPSENRLLAAFPARPAGPGGLKTFLSGWENYFNDHFGCRKTLVTWYNKLKWSVFEEKNARNVLVGSDGWMYASEKRMVENFRGALPFTEAELQAWQRLLEHRRDWLARRGIKYLFVLAPDKQSIYPEYLPGWLKDLGGRTKADQFFDYMQAHSTVAVLDLRPVLRAAKTGPVPVYLKTDTHWNILGAFLAYQRVAEKLGADLVPGLQPLPLDAFVITNQIEPGGDLVNLRGIRISMDESNAYRVVPKPETPVPDMFIPKGIHVMEMAATTNAAARGLAIVHTDSFGRKWIPWIGSQFGRTEFFWQYHLNGPVIEREKPVVVINEMLERFFNVTDPQELMARDVLP
jgi:hypothetical protein